MCTVDHSPNFVYTVDINCGYIGILFVLNWGCQAIKMVLFCNACLTFVSTSRDKMYYYYYIHTVQTYRLT